MTECARCGSCCQGFAIPVEDWLAVLDGTKTGDNAAFIKAHWTPAASSASRLDEVRLNCDAYDEAHQACTVHDQRPPVCRGYPWYDEDPMIRRHFVGLQCSYMADVLPADRPEGARPLIPLTVLR